MKICTDFPLDCCTTVPVLTCQLPRWCTSAPILMLVWVDRTRVPTAIQDLLVHVSKDILNSSLDLHYHLRRRSCSYPTLGSWFLFAVKISKYQRPTCVSKCFFSNIRAAGKMAPWNSCSLLRAASDSTTLNLINLKLVLGEMHAFHGAIP